MMRQRQLRNKTTLGVKKIAVAMFWIAAMGAGLIYPSVRADEEVKLAGNWSGDSICLDRQSACHDEKVIYRITLYADDGSRVKIQGDKIVNGQPVTMGTGDYTWNHATNTLSHEDQFGAWKISVKGNTMDGTMTSPAGKPFRHLTLKKDE